MPKLIWESKCSHIQAIEHELLFVKPRSTVPHNHAGSPAITVVMNQAKLQAIHHQSLMRQLCYVACIIHLGSTVTPAFRA